MTLPILLIPGLNCTGLIYQAFIADLWPHGSVTVANHQTGATMQEIAAAILAEAPATFALAGFSMGGYIAFEILRQAPDRVAKLALLDTSARPDTPEGSANRRKAMKSTEEGKFIEVLTAQYANIVHPDHANDDTLRRTYVAMGEAAGPETFIRHSEAIIGRPDSRAHLGAIKVPTLVLVGDEDKLTPPDAAKEMADAITGSELVTVKTAGHLTLLEQPGAVRDALKTWIA
jgi:pimeloyl-ACP methyl ester carboxylesterase